MAYVSSSRNPALGNLSVFARLGEVFAQFKVAVVQYREFRRTHAELATLSDRELNDLGLNRTMLTRVAWDSAVEATEGRKPV